MASPSKSKAMKTEHATSVHDSDADSEHKPATVRDVLHLEMVVQRVLLALSLSDVDAFLTVAAQAGDVAWLFEDATLWQELLAQHFGGRRDVTVDAPELADPVMDIDDEEEDESDVDDEEDEEENDGEDEEEDADSVQESAAPANTTAPAAAAEAQQPETTVKAEAKTPAEAPAPPAVPVDLPKWFASKLACAEATEFLISAAEWQRFQQRVHVIRGDIGTIADVDGRPIDGIAFPGTPTLHRPYNGAASIVFTRAGDALVEHTRTHRVQLRTGESHVTPGFNTGARVLIHCNGPYMGLPNLYPTLAKTYRGVLEKAVHENVECLAMTSISTGNLMVPVPEATHTAMQTIHKFLRTHPEWQGRIGIVCYEADVYEAFISERSRVLASFNATNAANAPAQ